MNPVLALLVVIVALIVACRVSNRTLLYKKFPRPPVLIDDLPAYLDIVKRVLSSSVWHQLLIVDDLLPEIWENRDVIAALQKLVQIGTDCTVRWLQNHFCCNFSFLTAGFVRHRKMSFTVALLRFQAILLVFLASPKNLKFRYKIVL